MVDPLILALDTSTSHAGAALVRSGETIAQTEWDWGRGRSGLLEAEVRALLRAAVSAPDRVVGALEREDWEAIRKRSEALAPGVTPTSYRNLAPQVGLIGSERLAATGKDSALEAVPAYPSPAGGPKRTRGGGG